jgi:peptidyl-prolyl cis-trans isomerase D
MLQSFRDNLKGATAFILVGIIIIPFAFWGVESLFVSGSSTEAAATVNGEDITELDVLRATEVQRQRLLAQFQDIPPLELSDEQLRQPVLNQLIRANLLGQFARSQGMEVSEQTFNELVVGTEAFQVGGRFDATQYEYLLGQQGYTPNGYRRQVKNDMLVSQVTAGIQTSAIVTPHQVDRFSQLVLQERSWKYVTLPLEGVIEQVTVTDAEVENYYQQHSEDFKQPDKVVVDYIEVTPEVVAPSVEVDEEAVKARFEAEQAKAKAAGTSWHLAHILVAAKEDGSHGAVLEELTAKLAQGAEFGQLAREHSDDFGSAESGGDIGVFTEDALPPEFGPAVIALDEGEVSPPVQSASGTHLIKLLAKTDAPELDYDNARERIAAELRKENAGEKLVLLVDKLKDAAYNADSLSEVANDLGLTVKQSTPFSVEGGEGIARFPQVLEAAFSEDVKEHNYASEVLEVGERHHVVIKLSEFQAAHVPSLGEVKGQISEILRQEKASALLARHAAELLAKVRQGTPLEEVATETSVTVATIESATRFDPRAESALMEQVFNHPSDSILPVAGEVETGGDRVVYQLTDIVDGSLTRLSAEERRQLQLSLNQLWSVREFQAYVDALEASAEIVKR